MLFRVVDKVKWNDEVWERLFNLIDEFKTEYNLKVGSMGEASRNKVYFSIDKYSLYFEPNSQGNWFSFEADTSKEDFDEKFKFIYGRLE